MLVRFPCEESTKQCKLSKPRHGPHRIINKNDPDATVVPVYFPESGSIQVHQSRVYPCPPTCKWPVGFHWHGGNQLGGCGGVPRWLGRLLSREPIPAESGDVQTEPTECLSQDESVPICDEDKEPAAYEQPPDCCPWVGGTT